MKKIVSMFYGLMLTLVISFLFLSPQTDRHLEMMINVQTEEDARLLAEMHEINLIEFSTFGFARYEVKAYKTDRLLQEGFDFNETLTPMAKWPTTTDPLLKDQYALDLMHVKEAWTSIDTANDVIIAIVDTGIDTDHEEFSGRILQSSYNSRTKVTSTSSLSHIEDDHGHGTMVAGIIAANKNNSKGIAGIVQGSMLLIIKANNVDNPLTEEDESNTFQESSIAEAIHYARQQGADVINLSLGSSATNSVTKDAVDQALAAGLIVIGASGNDGDTTKYYPASYPGVLSVGSVDAQSNVSVFSNRNDAIDVSAPGSQITSTAINNSYATGSGTSFAAPQVAGVVALMISYFPDMDSAGIINQLLSTVTDRGTIGYDTSYGYGIVNAAKALEITYVIVSFETYGGTEIAPIEVLPGYTFEVAQPSKVGHQFIGWYRDSLFTQSFTVGVDTTLVSITLHAKFQPQTYQVSLVVQQSLYDTLTVLYGDIPTLTDPVAEEGYTFAGWYKDITFKNEYLNTPITEDITLYAKFEPKIYTIHYYVNGLLYQKDDLPYLTVPEPPTPTSIFPFMGWYYDTTFIQPYVIEPITTSFVLYARFNDGTYTVTFYDHDLTTVLATEKVYYGFSATPPDEPVKPNSPSFTYDFSGWSESYQDVTKDLVIYPLYEKTYLKESIKLNPGVDTVSEFDTWVDAGITLLDSLLHVIIEIEELPPYVKVIYRIFEGDEEIDVRYRMVSIHQTVEVVTITLLPGVTTLEQGQGYQDAGAITNVGEINVISNVDTSSPGIYQVIYTVQRGDVLIQRTRYVYVLDQASFHPQIALYVYPRKEGWWIQ